VFEYDGGLAALHAAHLEPQCGGAALWDVACRDVEVLGRGFADVGFGDLVEFDAEARCELAEPPTPTPGSAPGLQQASAAR